MSTGQNGKACIIVLHNDTLSNESVLCGRKVLARGQYGYLSGSGTKTLCIRAAAPAPTATEVSVHVSLAERFKFENRSKGTVRVIEDVETATATWAKLIFQDQHLSRADMWQIKAQLEGKVLSVGSELKSLGTPAATVQSVSVGETRSTLKKVDSAFISHPRTKCIFRSASARFTIMIQISREMLEYWFQGSFMFEHLLHGFFAELFQRWTRLNVKHSVSIVLFGRRYSSSESPNDATGSDAPTAPEMEDFMHVVAVDLPSSDWRELMWRMKKVFQDPNLPLQVCPAAQGNMLEAIHLAAMDFADESLDPPLGSNGKNIMAVTAGVGRFEVDYKLLLRTTEVLLGTSIGVDIVALSPHPLHSVPLFQYQRDGTTEYTWPHWVNVSYWNSEASGFTSKWLMAQCAGEAKAADIQHLDLPVDEQSLDRYDEDVFASAAPRDFHAHLRSGQSVSNEPAPSTTGLTRPNPSLSAISPKSTPPEEKIQSPESSPVHAQPAIKVPRKGPPPHPLMQSNSRKISLGPRGLAPSQGLASTTLFTKPAEQAKDAPMATTPAAEESSGGLAKHLRDSIRKKPSQLSVLSNPTVETSPNSKPIDIQSGQVDPSEEGTNDPASMIERAVLGDNAHGSGADSGSHTPKFGTGSFATSMDHTTDDDGEGLAPWTTIRRPCQPPRGNIREASDYQKWENAIMKPVSSTTFKWDSICTPASLPLIASRRKKGLAELEKHFKNRVRRVVAIPVPDSKNSAAHQAMVQLVATRLAAGFQIIPVRKLTKAQMPSEDIDRMFLSLGKVYHYLHAVSDFEVQITEFHHEVEEAKHEEKNKSVMEYRCFTKSIGAKLERLSTIDLNLRHPITDWSPLDDQTVNPTTLAGGCGFSRMRFALIPVDLPKSNNDSIFKARELSDEEKHLEGIQKLTQLWQRNRFFTHEERSHQASMIKPPKTSSLRDRDPNPLAIEYQTRDPSAIVSAYGPSLMGEQADGEEVSKLFAESETYHSSNFDTAKLVHHLQEPPPNGVEVRDRRWFTRLHYKCFRGDEMTNWLLRVFKDLQTREDAVTLGNQLMDREIFTHVRGKHEFRDGNYFYQIKAAHRTTDYPDNAGLFSKGLGRTVPSTPVAEVKQSPAMRPATLDSEASGKALSTPRPGEIDRKEKKEVLLSQKIQYNVDPQKKSTSLEIVNLHFDRIHSPVNCYHIHLDWTCTTAKLVRESVTRWSALAETHGLKLVQLPLREACKLHELHPLDQAISVKLAVRPPSKMIATPQIDPQGMPPRSNQDIDGYHKALLRKLSFVLDLEAGSSFPQNLEVKYSWGIPDYRYTQFVHKSGLMLVQITNDNTGDFLLFPNRLALNTGIGGAKRVATESHSLESIVTSLKGFCRDRGALTAFYDEVNKPKIAASPVVNSAWSNDFDVPPMELPPHLMNLRKGMAGREGQSNV